MPSQLPTQGFNGFFNTHGEHDRNQQAAHENTPSSTDKNSKTLLTPLAPDCILPSPFFFGPPPQQRQKQLSGC